MKPLPTLLFVASLIFVTETVALAEDADTRVNGIFENKIVVARLAHRRESYALENASLKTMGGRTFLVGAKLVESSRKSGARPTIAISWDRVELLTIFENLQDFLRRNAPSDVAHVPVGFEINRLYGQIADLRPEIERSKRVIAETEVEIKQLKQVSAKAEDKETRITLHERLRRREEELAALKRILVELSSEKRGLEVLAEQMRHRELMRGKLP